VQISDAVHHQVEGNIDVEFEDRGPQHLKNIEAPVRAFAVRPSSPDDLSSDAPKAGDPNRQRTGLAIAGVVIAALVGALGWQATRPPTVEAAVVADMVFPLPDKPSIAVLAFKNLSNADDELLADSFSEDILTSLSKLSGLFVISRTTSFTYKGKDATVKQIAEDLGVRYVLEGSFQRDGDRIRVTAQLIDAIGGQHVWADRYDRELTDLFAVKDEITLNIVSNISAELVSGQRDLITSRETDNLEAWLLFYEGYDLLRRFTPEDNSLARELFSKAVSIDPGFATAYAAIGGTHRLDGQVGWTPTPAKSYEEAMKFFNLALEIDPKSSKMELAVLYQALGTIDLAVETAAEEALVRPNDFIVRGILGWNLNAAGRPAEALEQHKISMRLSPVYSDWILISFGDSHLLLGNFEKALEAYQAELNRPPNSPFNESWTHANLALVMDGLGDEEAAQAHIQKAIQIFPSRSRLATIQTIYRSNDPMTFGPWMDTWRRLGMPE